MHGLVSHHVSQELDECDGLGLKQWLVPVGHRLLTYTAARATMIAAAMESEQRMTQRGRFAAGGTFVSLEGGAEPWAMKETPAAAAIAAGCRVVSLETSTSCGVGNESKISTLIDSNGGRRGGKDKQWLNRWTRATRHAAA